METTKIKEKRISELKKEKQQTPEPKRLSKAGIWLRDKSYKPFKVADCTVFD